jgi:SAM-dependent methyltransferase
MNLKYLHIKTFYTFLHPFSAWYRKKRMRSYIVRMGVKDGMSILDLGGHPMIWEYVSQCFNLTILNLPGAAARNVASHHKICYVEGDACDVHGFQDRSFDSVFSNSVIEHVGPKEKRAAFAQEARRLGKSYWIQTPSKWFPIEAHCGMPFWWFYPAKIRHYFMERWRRKLPDWSHMVEETTVLTKNELRCLFPEATILVETFICIPKSYIAYFVGK